MIMRIVRCNKWTPFVSIIMFGIIWEVIVRISGVNQLLMPPLSEVLLRLVELLGPGKNGTPDFLLLRHLGSTLLALLIGFTCVSVFSSMLGLLMGMNQIVYAWLNPVISLFMVLPNVAFVPIVVLWLGLGMKTVVMVVIIGSCFPISYTAAAGVRSVPKRMIWVAQTSGATRWQILHSVLLGAAMPYLISGHKLALGQAWRAVLVGEIFASTQYGIGFMIFDARNFLDTKAMFAGIIVIGLLGLSLEKLLFGFIERHTLERWGLSMVNKL